MWHGQGEMSRLSKMSISIFLPHFLITSNASFWRKPHYNWISRNRVMKDLTMLKSISNKGIWTLFLPLSQKQHRQNPTHSSWSCHIFQKTNVFSLYFVWQKFNPHSLPCHLCTWSIEYLRPFHRMTTGGKLTRL